MISNLHRADFYKEDNGFLFQQEQQKINGESLPVDNDSGEKLRAGKLSGVLGYIKEKAV